MLQRPRKLKTSVWPSDNGYYTDFGMTWVQTVTHGRKRDHFKTQSMTERKQLVILKKQLHGMKSEKGAKLFGYLHGVCDGYTINLWNRSRCMRIFAKNFVDTTPNIYNRCGRHNGWKVYMLALVFACWTVHLRISEDFWKSLRPWRQAGVWHFRR